MLKKITAYSLIVAANIILLAHAVIPHHHHDAVVCFVLNHSHDDDLTHGHNHDGHKHQPGNDQNSGCCVLKQSFVAPATLVKQSKSNNTDADHHNFNYFIHSNTGFPDVGHVIEVAVYPPENSSCQIKSVTQVPGLRAPPAV